MNKIDEILDKIIIEIRSTTFLGEHNMVHAPTLEYLRDKLKHQLLDALVGMKEQEELQEPYLRQYENRGSAPFYCSLCSMSEMTIMENKKDNKYFCECSYWSDPHNAYIDRSGGNWLGWRKSEKEIRNIFERFYPNMYNKALDDVRKRLEEL